MHYDNPAARLHSLLLEGKNLNGNISTREAWHKILEISPINEALMFSRVAKVMELPTHAFNALAEIEPDEAKEMCNHWTEQINAAFSVMNMNASWSSFISPIDAHSMKYLSMTSKLLRASANTKETLGDEIIGIRENLNTILCEILAANLPDEIKKYLARNIRELITSIDEYKITGALPLLDAIAKTLGHAHVNKEYRDFLTDEDLGKRVFEALTAMANVVTVTVGLPQITQLTQVISPLLSSV